MPSDPYEAEILMMAQAVSGQKDEDASSSSDDDDTGTPSFTSPSLPF